MLETSARLLRLLSLFQLRRFWTGQDLAARLRITTRTVRRDVDKLRALGYPVHSAAGLEGGYQFGAGSTMPPLLLDDDEAVAVALGLRSAAGGSVRGAEEAALRALAKVEQMLPERLARRVSSLQTMIVTPARPDAAVDARTLSTLAAACRDLETVRFRYQDNQGAATDRLVEPHRVVATGQRWYLVAWDRSRSAWRTFRVDRIGGRLSTGPRFAPHDPPAADIAAYVTRGVAASWPCRARVKLKAPAAEAVQRIPAGVGTIEPAEGGGCIFETGGTSYAGLAMHLSLLGLDFEVSGPPELVREIRRLARRFHLAASHRS